MRQNNEINVGIGFATGRESGSTKEENIRLNLLAAYDLKYSNTKSTDYTNVNKKLLELIDATYFIGKTTIQTEIEYMRKENVINRAEGRLIFVTGYAGKRNIL